MRVFETLGMYVPKPTVNCLKEQKKTVSLDGEFFGFVFLGKSRLFSFEILLLYIYLFVLTPLMIPIMEEGLMLFYLLIFKN